MKAITLLSDIDLGRIINNINEIKATELPIEAALNTPSFFNGLESDWGGGFSAQKIIDKIAASPTFNPNDRLILLTTKPLDESIILFKTNNVVIVSIFASPDYEDYIVSSLVYLASIYLQENISAHPIAGTIQFNINIFINFIEKINSSQEKRNYYISYLYSVYTYKTSYAKEHSIILTHGINTHGEWTDHIATKLLTHGFESLIVKGFVKKTKFVFGIGRYESVEKLLTNIIKLQEREPEKKISIIAHSYGTLVLSKALKLAAQLKVKISINNIILIGSIIPSAYSWTDFVYADVSVKVTRVYNICGECDAWPVLASKFVNDAGHSGTFFFENSDKKIINLRLPCVSHTNMFTDAIFNQFYLKFLSNDQYRLTFESCAPKYWIDILFRILGLQ